jgi:hypothetical protein
MTVLAASPPRLAAVQAEAARRYYRGSPEVIEDNRLMDEHPERAQMGYFKYGEVRPGD